MKKKKVYILPSIRVVSISDEIMVIDGSGLEVKPGKEGEDDDPNAANDFSFDREVPSVWDN